MTILCFHNVQHEACDEFDRRLSRLEVDEFRQQVEFLRNEFEIVSLEAYLRAHRAGQLARRTMALTFDDGYRGVYDAAYPVLAELGLTAAVFVVVPENGLETEPDLLHFEAIEAAFRGTTRRSLTLDDVGLGTQSWETESEKVECMKSVKRVLKVLPESDRQRAHRQLLDSLGYLGAQSKLVGQRNAKLTLEQMRGLLAAGWNIGAHTCTHRTLSMLDNDEREREIVRPFAQLQASLSLPWVPFAYPYGGRKHFDAHCRDLVEQAGYRCALTMVTGYNHHQRDVFRLHRIEHAELMSHLRGRRPSVDVIEPWSPNVAGASGR